MTLRYKLRTLLILLAVVPPLLWVGWTKYEAWQAEQERQRSLREASLQLLLTRPPPAASVFRKPPGEIDYQFPPSQGRR